jgi:hypothetical protein
MTYQQNIGNVTVADGIYSFHFGGNGTSIGGSSGIIDALSISDQPWLELSVDGIAQSPRQKILTVPFAQVSRAVVHDYFTTTKQEYTVPSDKMLLSLRKDMIGINMIPEAGKGALRSDFGSCGEDQRFVFTTATGGAVA